MGVVFGHLSDYASGFWYTVALTLASFLVSLLVGIVIATMRISPAAPARAAGLFYVETVRNTPLLVLLFLFFFGLTKVGLAYSIFVYGVIVIGAYHGAFVAEALRSGVGAVSKGQAEAARSIGLTFSQSLRYVVLPQAFRTVVPPIGNIFIALTKNTSLITVIAGVDLTGAADRLNTTYAQAIPIFFGAAVAYLILTIPSGLAFGWIERKVAIAR